MIGTEVIVEGGNVLDVFEGLDFSFNYAVSDIRNPDTRQTEFTKTIKLPGSAKNNTLFGNLFEADIANPFDPNIDNIGVNFNPNKKASVQVLHNSLPVLDGSMQLRKITVTKGRVEYEVVFIGQLIDIFGVWGDRKLNEVDETGANIIDLSDYDHVLTDTVQSASWGATVGDGYVYPLIDYGRNLLIDTFGQRTYPIIDLRPALYVRTLWDKIFEFAGATYSGDFLENTQADGFDFDRLIIPWTAGFELSDIDIAERTIYAERGTDKTLFTTATEIYDMDAAPLNPLSQYNTTTDEFTLDNASTYVFEGVLYATVTRTVGSTPTGVVQVFIDLYINGSFSFTTGYCEIDLPDNPSIGQVATSACSWVSSEIVLNAGDVIQFKYRIDPVQLTILNGGFSSTLDSGTFVQCRPVNTELAFGDTVSLNFSMPDITIKDFFLSILKMFNLYMVPDKSIPNHYTFYTRDQFYASGQLKDWTYKMDRGQSVTVTPMGLLSGREYIYTYSEDGDYYNDRYQNNYGRVYGSRQLDIDNDFVPEKKENTVIFSPTPLVNDGVSARIIPKIYDSDISEGAQPSDANIRILYYGGQIDGVIPWRHGLTGTYYTTYPYAGHWNNPITPTLDINFGLSFEYYYQGNGATGPLTFTNNNLFKAYHERQFLEIASKDSKLVTAFFDLTALDIHQLDFRDTILIDQTYYRINKVMDYNPFKAGLTKVELFKAGDILFKGSESVAEGSGKPLGEGKFEEKAPTSKGKTLLNSNQYEPFQGKVIGANNVVSPNATGFLVQGDSNTVGASKNVTLIGSGNTVANGVENVVAIGVNNKTITESNSHVIGDCLCVRSATLNVTAAQVLTMSSVEIPFGLTVPTGYYVKPLGCDVFMDYNTTTYVAAGEVYIAAVGANASLMQSTAGALEWINSTIFQLTTTPSYLGDFVFYDGTDLKISINGSDPTTGDSALKVVLTYVLLPTP